MDRVVLSSDDWSSGLVQVATGFYGRWRGLKAHPEETSLLIRTSSVHGFGMSKPFMAVGLDKHLRVTATRLVRPRRVAWFRGARFVLELPAATEPPREGTALEIQSG